ncbi:hypothetical protein IHE45_14G051900 [Dioscorea alata]|uniref:Uncharacterized protein n=1 Tax=Dioscorea alata TaxID=55571 RepID=A0ACB7URR2_DIOAL|nr:hypothetical protein IHE45_14G051900 [Dioscorea alata]
MTTGRINQVAPSRATARGRLRGAPPSRPHTTPRATGTAGGERGSLGGTAPGDARRPRLACVAGDRDDGEGRRQPRVRSKWVSNPRGLPATRPRVDGGRANRRGRSGIGQQCRRNGRGKAAPPGGDRTLYRGGRCSRWTAGIGTQATGLAPRSGADGGPNEGAAPRRSDAARLRARRGTASLRPLTRRHGHPTRAPHRPAAAPRVKNPVREGKTMGGGAGRHRGAARRLRRARS